MRVLQIDEEIKHDAKKVIKYAKENIVTVAQLKLNISKDILPIGDNPEHVLHIHDGYRVVFSIEEQSFKKPYKGKNTALCNHLSISVESKDKYPNEHAVIAILELFDMETDFRKSLYIWKEEEIRAINILQQRIEEE